MRAGAAAGPCQRQSGGAGILMQLDVVITQIDITLTLVQSSLRLSPPSLRRTVAPTAERNPSSHSQKPCVCSNAPDHLIKRVFGVHPPSALPQSKLLSSSSCAPGSISACRPKATDPQNRRVEATWNSKDLRL